MIEDEEELTWMDLVQMKGRRAKRLREGDAHPDQPSKRRNRWSYYVKRADRRQDRHQAHMSLVKFYYIHRRKINWVSSAAYKGT